MLPDKPIPINSAEALLNLVNGTNPLTTINSRYKYIATQYCSDANTINLVFSDVPKTDSCFTYVTTTGQLSSLLNQYNVSCLLPKLQVCYIGDNCLETDLSFYYAGYYQTSNPTAYLLTLVTSKELLEDERFATTLSNR